MALALVQQGDTGSSGIASGSAGNVLPANCTPGNTVIALLWSAGTVSSFNITSMSSFGATGLGNLGGSSGLGIFAAFSFVTTVAGRSVTCGMSGSANWWGWGAEVSGTITSIYGGSSYGVSGTGSEPSLTTPALATGSLAALAVESITGLYSGPSSPWSSYDAGFFQWADGFDVAHDVLASPGPITASWGSDSSEPWQVYPMFVTSPVVYEPTPMRRTNQAVQRAASRMERAASGLFSPRRERITIPRIALAR